MPVSRPIKVSFGADEDIALHLFVKENLQAMINAYDKFHTEKIPEFRRLYKGQPEQETRDWPWPNASNTVIQLIAENVDTLKARIIGTIYEIMPLWTSSLVGDWPEQEEGGAQRTAFELFMNLMGMEPSELDLYRVESLAANDMIQFGSVLIKQPWETEIEKKVTGPALENSGTPATTELIKYDGPRPEKIPIEDWGATASAPTWEKAQFKYHKYTLTKQQILEKIHLGLFELSEENKEKLLKSPDRYGASNERQQKEQLQNVEAQHANILAEWDIYECWFYYWHNDAKWKIIFLYHKSSDIKCNAIFNFYPDNEEPFEFGRLGYTDDGLLGYGFAEMLKYYQEEVTTGHNQRNDNRTLGNTSVATVGRNNKIDANLGVYPMAVLPISTEEFGLHQLGVAYPSSVQEETLTIELAKARAGVDSGMSAMGGDVTNKKGQLSAMGTFSVLQSGNRRVNVNITDFRYMHLKLGRKAAKQYAEFGVGDRLKYFGEQAKYLKKALENIRQGRIDLPIRAANASINKELEKQNDMLLVQVMQRHHATIAQILQGLGNPQMPAELKTFLIGVIAASGELMSRILRNFGHDDISRLQPELNVVKMLTKGANENVSNRPNETEQSTSTAFPVGSNGQAGAVPAIQGALQPQNGNR
jgi:hypothetical protein